MFHKALIKVSVGAAVLIMVAGCAVNQKSHTYESGYSDAGKVQIQFYAPEGSMVTVGKTCLGMIDADRSHQVNAYPDAHKLEYTPEQFATFNLGSGTYEFKYEPIGWDDATLYGEVEVPMLCPLWHRSVRTMLSRTFIPVALPSPATVKAVSASDDLFPYQSSAHRLKISYQDVERLAAGDMVTKVVFVADLKEAEEKADELEVKLTEMTGERQRLAAMLNEAKMDWIDDPGDRRFIKLQARMTELDQDIRDAEAAQQRINALLRADKVLIRREMMVMATDELLPEHEDPVKAANELGQVVLIMRIGGRHMHWN